MDGETRDVMAVVERVEELDRLATPGPWPIHRAPRRLDDAVLIAEYRTDAPELAREVRAERKRFETMLAMLPTTVRMQFGGDPVAARTIVDAMIAKVAALTPSSSDDDRTD